MRRESYLSQPSEIEIYPVFSGTDVILRQSIELVEREEILDGKKSKYKVWECDEVQFHYDREEPIKIVNWDIGNFIRIYLWNL